VLLQREGWTVNVKRVHWLYREMGLQLRNKSPKRRVKAQLREDRSVPTAANQVWAMDFVHDQLFDGRKIRVLTIVDTFSRLSPAIDVRQSTAVAMSSLHSSGSAARSATRRQSGSTTGPNLSVKSSICGRSCAA
jgi:transposase InsO family protein